MSLGLWLHLYSTLSKTYQILGSIMTARDHHISPKELAVSQDRLTIQETTVSFLRPIVKKVPIRKKKKPYKNKASK